MPDEERSEGSEEVVSEGSEKDTSGEERAADDKGESGQSVPYHRFKEVNDKLKALDAAVKQYEKFGKPEDLARMKARMAEMEKSSKYTPSEKEQIRKEMYEAFPEMAQFQNYLQQRTENYTSEGSRKAVSYMKEVGLEATKQNRIVIENSIAAAIEGNEDYLRRFLAHDPSVYDDAWKFVKSMMYGKRGNPAAKVEALKRSPSGGGSKPAPKKGEGNDKPMSERDVLEEAHENAFAVLGDKLEG